MAGTGRIQSSACSKKNLKDPEDSLSRVCYYFQKHHVKFLIIGARACAFHGHIRATQDIDLLIQNDRENILKAIDTIRELYPHLQEELKPEDFYESIVVKILDDPEIDVSISARSVTYEDSLKDLKKTFQDGIEIPYMCIDSLIQTKSTQREQDQWDVKVLTEIKKKSNL